MYKVSWELGIDVDVIREWTPDKFEYWVAFFQIQDEAVKKANTRRKRKGK